MPRLERPNLKSQVLRETDATGMFRALSRCGLYIDYKIAAVAQG